MKADLPDPADGSLTVGQRLTRIETRLDTILGKMDTYAEEADMRSVDARVELLEREGSSHARHAETGLATLTVRVTALETALAVGQALRSNRRYMIVTILAMAGWGSVLVAIVAFMNHR